MKHRVVLCYGDGEHVPVWAAIGHNLKEKNVFLCDSKKIINGEEYFVVCSKTTEDSEKKDMKLLITYSKAGLVRGFLYIDEKEYPVLDYKVYESLQIEKYCYGNIAVVRVPDEFEQGNHIL
jgi:hypothetical protein